MKTHAINAVLTDRTRVHPSRLMQLPLFVLMVAIACIPNLEAANWLNAPAADSIHQVVDKQPAFKGKPSDIKKFIDKNLVYPDNAWVEGVEGIVEVSFVITTNGRLMNAKIEKSINTDLDMEAMRLVDLLVDWKPGLKDGLAVNTLVSIPIVFQLAPDEKEFIGMLRKYGLNENPPMYVIDDKIINSRIELPSYNLKSVRVMKGQKALERFGERARNGVVIVETKHGTAPLYE